MRKVSIIVPVHNVSKYLPTCLNSLVNQTEQSIEIICIHDHSTDNSLAILEYYEKMYPYKLKVIDMKDQFGVSCARNLGLSVAQGEYIGFADSDDIVSLNMFQDFSQALDYYQFPIIVGSCFRILDSEYVNQETFYTDQSKKIKIQNYMKKNRLFFEETPAVWDKLFLHSFIEGIKFLENHIYEDNAFTYPLLLKAKETLELIRDDYVYRMNPTSIMQSSKVLKSSLLDILDVYKYSLELGKKFGLKEEEMKLLKDVMKQEVYSKIIKIQDSKLSKKEKQVFIGKILSYCEFYFPDFLSLETTFAQRILPFSLNALQEYSFEPITKEREADFVFQHLKKKLNTMEKSSLSKT